jgi:O-methyltransferase
MIGQAKRLAAAIYHLWSLADDDRQLAFDMLRSGLGMHGERFRFAEDGLCTIHNCDFLTDPRFSRAYAAGLETDSWKNWSLRWRAYVVCWASGHASVLKGDFAECGVNKGGNGRMIIEYLGTDRFLSSKFYLLDTFEGFDTSLLSDSEKATVAKNYRYESSFEAVKNTFASFPFVKIIKGSVPDTLQLIDSQVFAFVSLDMNCVRPEIAAAEFFWPKLVSGGIMLLDDYGFSAHIDQKDAFDLFATQIGVQILSLPTGQGLMIKV